jgi:ElaB/YqjD/DUF883 family membrane-anchored ribosome-binding protein
MTTAAAGRGSHGRSTRKNGLADALRATRQSRAAVARDFESLIDDAEDLLHSTTDAVGDQATAARARLEKSLTQARDRLSDQMDSITERGREAAAAADDYVHSKPWQVIGVAAAAALVAGFFLSRR